MKIILKNALFLLFFLGFFHMGKAVAETSWFQDHWVSDIERDIEILAEGDPEGMATLRDGNYRGHDWIVESDSIEIRRNKQQLWIGQYSIRPLSEGRYEMLQSRGDRMLKYLLLVHDSGYCVTYFGDVESPKFPEGRFYGCFVRRDA